MSFTGAELAHHAATRPGQTALVCGEESLTFAILHEQIEALALQISGCLPSPQQGQPRIGVFLEDPLQALLAFFAAGRAGGIALMLDTTWPDALRDQILAASVPDLVIDAAAFPALLAGPEDRKATAGAPLPFPAPEDLFYAGFTSGSTGVPKGFARTHRSWTESFRLSAAAFGTSPEDKVLVCGGLVHSLHLYAAVEGLCAGASVEVMPRFQPKAVARRLADAGMTILYATPTQLQLILRDVETAPALRLVLSSGAKLQPEDRQMLSRHLPGARTCEFYGASEMSFISLQDGTAPEASVGRPFPGVDTSIRDAQGRVLPPGQVGHLWVRSPLLFDRYICGGGEEVRWQDGWLTIGDRGWIDEAGFLYLAGRDKRMINSSGLNIFPEEVEKVLRAVPGVTSAAVFGVQDRLRGQKLTAAIWPEPEAAASLKDGSMLRRAVLTALGRARCPRVFLLFDAFPLTPGGKTDLPALENAVQARLTTR
ncbi:AMP-binding protein [Pannonibacter phragmitetus]|uniref:AMP-binding protein n=1 Tax=Pannonibacter phragmitetus TaxID=121719 RepID=UPI003D2F4383